MDMHETYDEPCYTCRRRHIQCDQSQIPCTKCEKAGLECFEKRPLRWVKGVAIRGNMQGRSFDNATISSVAKTNAIPRPMRKGHNTIKSPVKSLEPMFISDAEQKHSLDVPSVSLPLALEDPSISNLNGVSRYYLDYYNERICKLFIVYDSDKNPFRSLIAIALSDLTLLKSLLALAARHKANTGHSFHQFEVTTSPELINSNRDALFFKIQAMQSLSRALNDPILYRQDATVVSVFLLIFLDLLESGSDRWNFHLEGAKKIISSNQFPNNSQATINQDPGRTIQQIRNFITSQIYLIETLGGTFVRPQLLSQFVSQDWSGTVHQENVEESFLGCPNYLLNTIQSLSRQRDIIADMELPEGASMDHYLQSITAVLESIWNFDCYAWASSQSSQYSIQDVNNLWILSQSYKTGALIYGRRILDAVTKNITPQDDMLCELIGLIGALKDDNTLFKCILWPIFVAGLECRDQIQQDFLTGCLEKFWVDTNCLNVINAAALLKAHWKQENQQAKQFPPQWIFNIGQLGRDWLLI